MNVAGIALDLSGAILLAWGLLAENDDEILHRTVPMTGDLQSSAPYISQALRARRLARSGAGLLVIGFTLQLLATL